MRPLHVSASGPPDIHAADRNPRPVATGVGTASWPGGRGRSEPIPHSLTEHLLCPEPQARPGRESAKWAPGRSGFLFSLALEGRTEWVAFFFLQLQQIYFPNEV